MRVQLRFLAAAAALSVAACSESTSAPRASNDRASASDRAPSFDYGTVGSFGRRTADFALTSNGGSFNVNGMFTVNFPKNSVCDPDQSTYGPGEWDKPCVTLSGNKTIALQATVQLTSTGVTVDFQPALRFSPDAQVTISTDIFAPMIVASRGYLYSHPAAARPLAVYYSPALGASLVPDYLSDRTAVTHVDLSTGKIWRRIKHFSGWSQTSGEACDPRPDDPDCIEVDGP